jgi:CRISPR/Cas system CSM-associated protein Csm2 small subunit
MSLQTLGDAFGQKLCRKCGAPINPKFEYCFEHKDEGRTGNRGTPSSRTGRQGNRPSRPRDSGKASSPREVYPESAVTFESYLSELNEKQYFVAATGDEPQPKCIREELLTEHARVVALQLVKSNVTTSQLRRFFNLARGIEQQLKADDPFTVMSSQVARLPSQAASLVGREQSREQRERLEDLHRFIVANANLARRSREDFLKGFLPHFESVKAGKIAGPAPAI